MKRALLILLLASPAFAQPRIEDDLCLKCERFTGGGGCVVTPTPTPPPGAQENSVLFLSSKSGFSPGTYFSFIGDPQTPQEATIALPDPVLISTAGMDCQQANADATYTLLVDFQLTGLTYSIVGGAGGDGSYTGFPWFFPAATAITQRADLTSFGLNGNCWHAYHVEDPSGDTYDAIVVFGGEGQPADGDFHGPGDILDLAPQGEEGVFERAALYMPCGENPDAGTPRLSGGCVILEANLTPGDTETYTWTNGTRDFPLVISFTSVPTPTVTPTFTPTPTHTPGNSPTPTDTNTPEAGTPTDTPTETPTGTLSFTPTHTFTPTPVTAPVIQCGHCETVTVGPGTPTPTPCATTAAHPDGDCCGLNFTDPVAVRHNRTGGTAPLMQRNITYTVDGCGQIFWDLTGNNTLDAAIYGIPNDGFGNFGGVRYFPMPNTGIGRNLVFKTENNTADTSDGGLFACASAGGVFSPSICNTQVTGKRGECTVGTGTDVCVDTDISWQFTSLFQGAQSRAEFKFSSDAGMAQQVTWEFIGEGALTSTPTNTPTNTNTPSPTASPTRTPTATRTVTPTRTFTPELVALADWSGASALIALWSMEESSGDRALTAGACGTDCDLTDVNTVPSSTSSALGARYAGPTVVTNNEWLECAAATCETGTDDLKLSSSFTIGCLMGLRDTAEAEKMFFGAGNDGTGGHPQYAMVNDDVNDELICRATDSGGTVVNVSTNNSSGSGFGFPFVGGCQFDDTANTLTTFTYEGFNTSGTLNDLSTTVSTDFHIFVDDAEGTPWRGDVDECYVYDGLLTEEEMCRVACCGWNGAGSTATPSRACWCLASDPTQYYQAGHCDDQFHFGFDCTLPACNAAAP